VPEFMTCVQAKTLSSSASCSNRRFHYDLLGSPEVRAGVVDGSYFDVVGLHPVLGRLIGPQDDVLKPLAALA